jgi:ABC-type phosphate transport system substrate-binding protein
MTSHVAAVARSRAVMLAIGAGILTSLAVAAPSYADAPSAGSACQASGKVTGRGATFQTDAQQLALIPGYRLDVCGPVPDANGNDMVFYNYAPGSNGLTGSGNGINAAKCRSDAFAGSDGPVTKQDVADTRVAPGAMPAAVLSACAALSDGIAPDLTPLYNPTPGPWPNAADTLATFTPTGAQARTGAMQFPVAGASVAMGVNLTAANCPGLTAAPSINLTSSQASRIFGGLITSWNDPALTTTSPNLASCPVAITRVVRLDKSGTTQTFKNYLGKADGATVLCDGVNTWTALKTDANNVVWPENPPANTCTPNQLQRAATTGGPAVVTKVQATPGAIGYADLADWGTPAVVQLANVAPASAPSGPTFLSPAAGTAANCTFAGATAPGTSASDSVGVNPNTNIGWATDASPNKSDITFIGDGYPICGFTWDLVYVGLNHNGASLTAISRLSDNQRRTLYSYFSYVFTPYAQDRLAQNKYAKLPDALLAKFRAGFQQYF